MKLLFVKRLKRVSDKKRKIIVKRVYILIQRKPFAALFTVLGLFLILMSVGNLFFAPKPEPTPNPATPKLVKIYKLGSAPQISYQGKIEKSGVVKIVAQMSGIVSSINVYEGQEVSQGTNILSLSSNYGGGNTLSIAREIAAVQYQNAKDTFDTQKEIIAKQKESADKNKDNTDLMRQIAEGSANDTQSLVNLNQEIVNSIQAAIYVETDPALLLQEKEALAQFKSALIQTQSSYKNLQIQANDKSKNIATLAHDTAIKQLDLQEKTLQMTLDISSLQLRMAQVNEANMFPSSPFSGTVDKIFVHEGDSVNSGTILAQISGDSQHAEVVVNVPEDVAKNISSLEPSVLYFPEQTIQMTPTFISKDATAGVLYSVIYDLGDLAIKHLTDLAYVEVAIPIGVADTTNEDPFVPLDAVIQTQEEAFIYVADSKNIVRSKKVKLGQIQGKYVEILSGLPKNAQVIVDRNVIEGDKVAVSF